MGFLGDLFFGTPSKAETTSASTMTAEQDKKLKELLAQLNVTGSPASAPYTGDLTAAPNAAQGASLAALEQAAMNAITPGGPNDVATRGLTEVINAKPQDITDYIQSTVVDPTMQNFIQQILPAISGRFSGMSGFGSDRILQEGIAAGNVATGIASARGTAAQTALQEQQKNKIAAALGLPSTQSSLIDNILKIQSGGAAGQAVAQQPLTNAYLEFQRQQQAQQANLDTILQSLGLRAKENITTVTPGTSGLVQGLAGGFAQGVGSNFLK